MKTIKIISFISIFFSLFFGFSKVTLAQSCVAQSYSYTRYTCGRDQFNNPICQGSTFNGTATCTFDGVECRGTASALSNSCSINGSNCLIGSGNIPMFCPIAGATPRPATPAPTGGGGGSCGGGSNPACYSVSNCGQVGKVAGTGSCSGGQMCCVDGGGGGGNCTVEFQTWPNSVAVGQTATLQAFARGGLQIWDGNWGWMVGNTPRGTFNPGHVGTGTTYTTTFTGTSVGTSTVEFIVELDNGTDMCLGRRSITVVAAPPPAPTLTFSASPTTITAGGTTNLTWSSANTTSCTATSSPTTAAWNGAPALSGSQNNIILTQTTTFNLSCSGAGGTVSRSVTVNVNAAPAPTVNLLVNGLNQATVNVGYNSSNTVSWSSSNATSCRGYIYWGDVPKGLSGSESTGAMTADRTYGMTCWNAVGAFATDTIIIDVAAPAVPTVNLVANPTSVAYNSSSTLTWTTSNVTSCNASSTDGKFTGSKTSSGGSQSITGLTANATYTISCSGTGGSATDTATVTVGAPPAQAPTVSLNASPLTVSSGGSSTLTWTSTNTTTCTASNGWSGTKGTSGSQSTGALSSARTFTITCTGAGGSATASVTVNVSSPVPTVNLIANPGSVSSGSASTLTWSSTNATTCSASGGWSGTKGTSGSQSTGNISSTTNFLITCTGAGGSASASTTVTVNAAVPTVNLIANPGNVSSGGSSNLSWTSTGATTCTASNGWSGTKGTSGSQSTGALSANRTFILTCTGPGGSASDSVTVTVNSLAPSVNISANPVSVSPGSASTITWSSSNTTTCSASGGWSGTKGTSGSQSTGNLSSTTNFLITCTGPGGSASDSVTVTVNAAPPTLTFTANPTTVNSGSTTNLSWSSTGATTCNASGGWSGGKSTSGSQVSGSLVANTTFTLSCTGAGGTTSRSVIVTVIAGPNPPSVSITANPGSVTSGSSSNLSWNSSGATTCSASGGWSGSKSVTGSQSTGSLLSTTNFFLTCTGAGGSNSASTTVTVGAPPVLQCNQPAPDDPPTYTCTPCPSCSTSVVWHWFPVAGATEYEIDIYNATTGTTVINNGWQTAGSFNCGLGVCSYPTNLPNGNYYSRVRARGTCTQSNFSQSSTITVGTCVAPTVTLNVNPAAVQSGSTTNLSWSSTGATTCNATGGWSGAKAISGSQISSALFSNTTFTLTCSGVGGVASASRNVTVSPPPSCNITLPAAINIVVGDSTSITPSIVSQQNGTITRIDYDLGGSSVASANPASVSSGTFSTNITGVNPGTTTLTAQAYMNGVITCGSGPSLVNVTNPRAWLQAGEGGVSAGGSVTSEIPSTCTPPNCDPVLIEGNAPGSVIYGSGSANFGSGNASSQNYLANTSYQGKRFDYAFFDSLIPSDVVSVSSFITGSNSLNEAQLLGSGTVRNGYRWIKRNGNLALNGNINLGNSRVILFVNGNLTINGNINLNDGSGFLITIVSGDTSVNPSVGGNAGPHLEGLFETDGTFASGIGSSQLLIRGSVVGLRGVNFSRDLGAGNQDSPSERVVQAPDLLALYPSELSRKRLIWQEIAP